MNLILLGLPGAGKGTQAKKISQEYKLTHIATGDIFRRLIKDRTPLGLRAEKYIKEGRLVPDEDAVRILRDELSKLDIKSRFVLDGFPRTLNQARILTEILEGMDIKPDLVFFIDVDPEELVERISERRVCLKCGSTYHLKHNPPQTDGICDFCGEKLIQRNDDREDTVRKRIQIHLKEIKEIVKYYKEKGLLEVVRGDTIEELYGAIKKAIEVKFS
ncbi:MAG: adenylate kinase [Halanaerobiaceae bacterium]|nr:adenylate kinase [Halanaerobiaceae bacterium]